MKRISRRIAVLSGVAVATTCTLVTGLGPASAATPSSHNPFGYIDRAVGAKGQADVVGCAADPDKPSQPLVIHMTVDHKYTLNVPTGVSRPDVQQVRHTGPKQGFAGVAHLKAGKHTLCPYALIRPRQAPPTPTPQ